MALCRLVLGKGRPDSHLKKGTEKPFGGGKMRDKI